MNIFKVNKYFDTSNKPSGYKGFGKALTIWSLIVIAVCMISVWGEICESYSYIGRSSFSTNSSLSIGIEAYVYSGWKVLSAANAQGFRYAMFIILILLFVGTLAVTYFFGVKAFVEGLGNMSRNGDYNIFPYVLIIAIANLVYFNFGNALANGTFAFSNYSTSWGGVLCALVLVPLFIATLIFNIIASFDKEKVPEFVGKIFIAISICFCIAIMDNVVAGYFDASSAKVGMFYPFGVVAVGELDGGPGALFIIQGIICLITYFLALFVAIKSVIYVTTDFPKKSVVSLIVPAVMLFLAAISMFTNGITAEYAPADTKVTVSSEVVSSFICAVIIATFYLTNYFINNKDEEDRNENAQPKEIAE